MKRATLILAFAGLAIAGSMSTSAIAQSAKKITFLTNYVYNGRHAPFFVGLEKGFYKEAGFDIDIKPATGSGFVITAIDGGKADYGMADVSSVAQGIAKGARSREASWSTPTSPPTALRRSRPIRRRSPSSAEDCGGPDRQRARDPADHLRRQGARHQDQLAGRPIRASTSRCCSAGRSICSPRPDGDVPALARSRTAGKTVHFSSFADWGYDIYGYAARFGRGVARSRRGEALRRRDQEGGRIPIKNRRDRADHGEAQPDHEPRHRQDAVGRDDQVDQTPYVAKNGYGAATDDRIERSIALYQKALKLEADLKPADLYVQLDK